MSRSATRRIDAPDPGADLGVIELDAEWRVVDVNPSGAAMLARRPADILGRILWEAFPDLLSSDFGRHYRSVMATQEPTSFAAFYPPLDTWFDVRASPRPGAGLTVQFTMVGEVDAVRAERERLLDAEREARLVAEVTHERLDHSNGHDHLTGLANRTRMLRWLEAKLGAQHRVSVYLCDLADFRRVNDSLGHTCGDDLLRQVADRLRALAGPGDLVARVGGNEFVLAVAGAPQPGLAEAIRETASQPTEVSGRRVVIGASLGVADSELGIAGTAQELLRQADVALYRAKERGGGRAVTYDHELHDHVVDRFEIEADLRNALERGELHLAYQPSFDPRSGRASGCEVLARWDHPTRGSVPPSAFIPVAEGTGLIIPLGEWVLRAAAVMVRGGAEIIGDRRFTVWVNVSARQFLDPSFLPMIERHIGGIEQRIGLEVTESVLLDDPTGAAAKLQQLVDAGVEIAIDDFGTGYSSLARLTHYPLHVIKIDQSFVAGIEDRQHRAIVVAIVELAHALGARTLAEGVETAEQLRILREIGCDEVSGYLLARPTSLSRLRDGIISGAELLAQDRLALDWAPSPERDVT